MQQMKINKKKEDYKENEIPELSLINKMYICVRKSLPLLLPNHVHFVRILFRMFSC
jgi:hypothetical protein